MPRVPTFPSNYHTEADNMPDRPRSSHSLIPDHPMIARVTLIFVTTLAAQATQAQIAVSAPIVMRPAEVTCTNMAIEKRVPCPDSRLFFDEGQGVVQDAFNRKEFSKLDALYERWCTGKDRFPDGRWKLSQYQEGLSGNFSAWNNWAKDLAVIQSWQQAAPTSSAARFAEAIYWHTYAWKARGHGYGSTVSKEGWEIFRERLTKAQAILEAMPTGEAGCAAPEALRLYVLTELGRKAELAPVYDRASRRFPEYHGIYFAMARHLEPKWGGSAAQYEAFADRVAKQTKDFEGMGMYARLYWIVDNNSGLPFLNDPLRAPAWNKLKAGYEDLMRLYPSSMHNLGKFTDVACRSTDGELYRKLRTRLAGYEHTVDMLDPVDVCDRRHQWAPAKE